MSRWHVIPFLIAFVLFVAPLDAQSNQVVDRLLDQKAATFADAAYLILSAAGIVSQDATSAEVISAVESGKMLAGHHTESQPITLGEVCYLIMKTQKMKGGLFYAIFPGPRYAAREFAYLHIIRGNTHPTRTVTGEEVIRMLGDAMERNGGQS
jgi:hypothetical protein